ncbi:MAG: B12-binding domain-containing radical SAM protein [Candidatus Helarchaeota archaeon]
MSETKILFVYVDTIGISIWDKKDYILNNPEFDSFYDKEVLNSVLNAREHPNIINMLYSVGNVSGEFLAQNIGFESRVIHEPISVELLNNAIKNFKPSHVGFTIMLSAYNIFKKCVHFMRKNYPQIKIIAGGVGALIEETKKLADYTCTGEGVRFIRQILGDKNDRPLRIPRTIIKRFRPLPNNPKKLSENKVAILTTNLGCGNGCDFCITYALYKRSFRLGSALEIKNALIDMGNMLNREDIGVILTDPIGLVDERKWNKVIELMKGENKRFHLSLLTSSKLVNKYSSPGALFDKFQKSEELEISLIELGLETLEPNRYKKNEDVEWKKLVDELSDRGIISVLSMIIGLDHQNYKSVIQEVENAITFDPTLLHVTNLRVLPETKLWKDYKNQGRLLDVPPEFRMLYGYQAFKHPHLRSGFKDCLPLMIECEELISKNLGSFYNKAIKIFQRRNKNPYNNRLIKLGESFKSFERSLSR